MTIKEGHHLWDKKRERGQQGDTRDLMGGYGRRLLARMAEGGDVRGEGAAIGLL